MKRKDLNINAADIIKYCEQEHRFQKAVYAKKIANKKMTKQAANVYYAIIQDVHDIAKALHQRNISWDQLRDMVDDLPVMPPK